MPSFLGFPTRSVLHTRAASLSLSVSLPTPYSTRDGDPENGIALVDLENVKVEQGCL